MIAQNCVIAEEKVDTNFVIATIAVDIIHM
jgi:hypothetical protein